MRKPFLEESTLKYMLISRYVNVDEYLLFEAEIKLHFQRQR